jgi:hypothetical protein
MLDDMEEDETSAIRIQKGGDCMLRWVQERAEEEEEEEELAAKRIIRGEILKRDIIKHYRNQ